MDKHYLTTLFSPESVVVFAGNEERRGQLRRCRDSALRESLRTQRFSGKLVFVDIETTGTLADLAQTRADLAIIALPATDVAAALELAGRMACRAALVISSGIGADEASATCQDRAARRRLSARPQFPRVSAPGAGSQCQRGRAAGAPGIAGAGFAVRGTHGVDSGLGRQQRRGFFLGDLARTQHGGIDISQVLDYLASDPQTHSIVVYLEGISNARSFMSALRSAANAKPVVVLKSGRKPAGNAAAQTHSGAIVGSDDVFDAALRRAGAVRVRSFVELFSAAKCLASRYRPVGRRLAVVTNGGGPGVLAADWINEIFLDLGRLVGGIRGRPATAAAATGFLDRSDRSFGRSGPRTLSDCRRSGLRDRQIDGVLAIYSPKRA
jgi:acetyltransferase